MLLMGLMHPYRRWSQVARGTIWGQRNPRAITAGTELLRVKELVPKALLVLHTHLFLKVFWRLRLTRYWWLHLVPSRIWVDHKIFELTQIVVQHVVDVYSVSVWINEVAVQTNWGRYVAIQRQINSHFIFQIFIVRELFLAIFVDIIALIAVHYQFIWIKFIQIYSQFEFTMG